MSVRIVVRLGRTDGAVRATTSARLVARIVSLPAVLKQMIAAVMQAALKYVRR